MVSGKVEYGWLTGKEKWVVWTLMDFNPVSPNAIARLSANLGPQNYHLSRMVPGEDVVGESHDSDKGIDNGILFNVCERFVSTPLPLSIGRSFHNYILTQQN